MSERFRSLCRARCLRFNALQQLKPKCGATKRSDGQPCQNPGLANGRCRLHGGATPSGPNWHVVQYPKADGPASTAKFEKKLIERDRLARKLAKRLTRMSPEQRARYDAWQRTHQPGPAAQRAVATRRAADADATRTLLAGERSLSPDVEGELRRLRRVIAYVEGQLAQAEAPAIEAPEDIFA